MDILRRNLAPITDEAWELIDAVAAQTLKANLSARKFVDFEGPKGWDYAGVPLGRLDPATPKTENGIQYGVRTILPLVEARAPFELDIWEVDDAVRGAKDVNLTPLEEAVRRLAMFEEKAIYDGFEGGHIRGLKASSSHDPIRISGDASELLRAVSNGVTQFAGAGVEGPYHLICGPDLWQRAVSEHPGCPLSNSLEKLINGSMILNPFLEETMLVSTRGGDMLLTVGVDFSVGFNSAEAKKVNLYLTESFTFRVLNGAAIIPIEWSE